MMRRGAMRQGAMRHRAKGVLYYSNQDGETRYVLPRGAEPPQFWTLFGGVIEQHERNEDALRREIEEESNSLITVRSVQYTGAKIIIPGYRADVRNPIPTPTRNKSMYHLYWVEIDPVVDQQLTGEMEYMRSFSLSELRDLVAGGDVDGYALWPVDVGILGELLAHM